MNANTVEISNKIHFATTEGAEFSLYDTDGRRPKALCGQRSAKIHPNFTKAGKAVTCQKCIAKSI